MNKKIKILVIPSDNFGVGKFRSINPHVYIQEHYSDLFDIDIVFLKDFPQDKPLDEFLKPYDIIHIHKQLDKNCQLINMMKFLDKKVIVDVDDNYDLGDYHPLSISAKREKWADIVINHLRLADMVTTTTPIYREKLLKHNKNVKVFPNAIDPTEPQMIPKPTKSNKLRFGIVCGSSHLHDISLLKGLTRQLSKDILDKIQFVLCGFDTNGTKTIYNPKTGEQVRQKIEPQESVWYEYEKIITDNYSIVSLDHKRFLHLFIPQSEYPNLNETYRRCWTKDINHYAEHYNNIDVLLVPLKECDFSKMKSQLKVIEAGFFNKGIIAQNFGPYTIDLKNILDKGGKIDENGNALLVDSVKNHKQWAKYIKLLVENPEILEKMKVNLYNTVKDKYSIETVCKERVKTYLEMMNQGESIDV